MTQKEKETKSQVKTKLRETDLINYKSNVSWTKKLYKYKNTENRQPKK